MQIELKPSAFRQAIPVLKQIESHGYEAYFVGGSVRDLLLGHSISDIDIATSAFPHEIQLIFPKHFDVGIEHGTVVVLFGGASYEITTFRTESTYTDFRRPDHVEFVRSLEEDTLRRDFTVNAMALNHQGDLLDYHGGYQDLASQLLRAVGRPLDRFQEDALRMMRGLRFASQLGFRLEEQTFQAMVHLAPNLSKIAVERVRIELEKLMQGNFYHQSLPTIKASGLFNYFPLADRWEYLAGFDWIASHTPILTKAQKSSCLIWALLLQGMGVEREQDQKQLLKAWTLSNQLIQQVMDFLTLDRKIQSNQLDYGAIYPYDPIISEEMIRYLEMNQADKQADQLRALINTLPIQQRKDLHMDGRRIMQLLEVQRGGPFIGQILDQIEQEVLAQSIANQGPILDQWVLNHYAQGNGGERA